MSESSSSHLPKSLRHKEYEDPHYHDEEDFEVPHDDRQKRPGQALAREKILKRSKARRRQQD